MASQPVETVAYGDHPSQVCDLYRPAGDGPYPVAGLIHGGFWRARYGRELEEPLARDLVARGWAAWNVEYRRLGEGGGWPAALEDVCAAVGALGDAVEAQRVVAIGHSAGGQLAVLAAQRLRLAGAVSQAGALDLDELWRLGTSDRVVEELLGGGPDEVPERYDTASPARRLPVGVPLLLVHGTRDDDVPVHISQEFAAAARAAGDDCALAVIEDEGHYEHLEPGSRSWASVLGWFAARSPGGPHG
ncbi:MAG TPA: alpha/beta fold hydrolase [Solirubrobacteraceae bacterium]|nr:alpha/beta fold hydrolase [Solirubrobacteraceae bacterium]